MSPHLIQRVTILGTGLIGGSFALALRKYTTDIRIAGWDRADALREARARQIIDDTHHGDLAPALRGADLIYIALPIGATLDLLPDIARLAPGHALITDACSTKLRISQSAAELFSDGYQNHQVSAAAPSPPPNVTPKQGTVAFFKARLTGLPDLKVTIEAIVTDKGHVAASFVYTGTHKGTYFGIAPTGRSLRFTSCDIFRVQDERIVEHWGMGDIAGVLAQLRA